MHANVDKAQRLLRKMVPELSGLPRPCHCGEALKTALFTAPEAVTAEARQRLDLLVGRYGYGVVR
jgi:5'-methylthioadenosine phosphorylase